MKKTEQEQIPETVGGITLGILAVIGIGIGGTLATALCGWLVLGPYFWAERHGIPPWAVAIATIVAMGLYGAIYRWRQRK
jgi:hypothetical protein